LKLRIQTAITKNISFVVIPDNFIVSTFLLLHGYEFASFYDIKSFVEFALPDYVLIQMDRYLFDKILQFVSLFDLELFEDLYFVEGCLQNLSFTQISLVHQAVIRFTIEFEQNARTSCFNWGPTWSIIKHRHLTKHLSLF